MPTNMDLKNRFSARERTLILEVYFATKSFLLVKRSFARSFPDQKVPTNSTISRLIRKFLETGCVSDDSANFSRNTSQSHCELWTETESRHRNSQKMV